MKVRAATAADVAGIVPMVRAICAMHREMDGERFDFLPDVAERYARWLPGRATDPMGVLLVAEDEHGALAGFVVGGVERNIPIYETERYGYVYDLWVEPGHRGKGVGGMLIDAAVARFAEIGVGQVRLETAAGNESARRLFASRGFRVSAVEMMSVQSGGVQSSNVEGGFTAEGR